METISVVHPINEVRESTTVQDSSSHMDKKTDREDSKAKSVRVKEDAEEIAEKMNQVASVFNTGLVFSVDEPTGRTVIKVMDRETEETIRQISPEKMVRLIGKLRYAMGLLLNVEI